MEEPEDLTQAPEVPGACGLSAREPYCLDDSFLSPSLGGASGLGGSGSGADAVCLMQSMAELRCPSRVTHLALGRGSAGELDLAAGQKGTNGREANGATYADERLHLSTYRLEPGEASAAAQTWGPIEMGQSITAGVVPGNQEGDSLLVLHHTTEHPEPRLLFTEVFSNGSGVAELPATAQGRQPVAAAGPVGERAYLELLPSEAALVEGLLDDPRRTELGQVLSWAIDYDEIGEPYVLLHQADELRLFGGSEHDELLWSEVRGGSSDAQVDLLVGGNGVPDRRYMLVFDAQTTYPHLRVQEGSDLPASGSLARGEDACAGWSLNFDCSGCPVGTQCSDTDFLTRGARLFAFGDRVLVAVDWLERVETRVADTDTSPLGICVCDSTLVSSENEAEYLSVYEIGYRGPETTLELSLVYEERIGLGTVLGDFGFARGAADGLDFWYGPELASPEGGFGGVLEDEPPYVIEHFGF